MSTEDQESKVDQMANLVVELQESADDEAFASAKDLIRGVMAKKTAARANVEGALEDQSNDRVSKQDEARPAGQAGRTVPAHLSDSRYRALDTKYQFRSPDQDVVCKRYLQALKVKDFTTLRELAADDNRQRAALAIGDPGANFGISDGTGAQLLPLPLANYLQNVVYRTARMRNWARRFDASTGNSIRIPIQDVASTTVWKAEAATYDEDTPAVGDGVKLDLQKLTNLSDITDEMLESSAFNVGSWLTQDVGEAMAEEEDLAMYQSGAGAASDEPIGLEASDTTTAAAPLYYVAVDTDQTGGNDFTSVATLTAAHLTKMFFSLPERNRRQAIWTGSDAIAQILSNLVDDNGRPILNFANNPLSIVGDVDSGGQIGTIFGRPFVNMPGNEGVGEDANRIYFARMDRTYAILEKGQITASASEHFKFNADVTTFKFRRRVDGQPIGNRTTGLPFDYVYSGNLS